MSVELAPLRGGAGQGERPALDSATNEAPAPLANNAQTHRPVLLRALQFCGVVLAVGLAAFALSALSSSSSSRHRPSSSSSPDACRWPSSPLSYSLLLRLDDEQAVNAGRFRAHSTALLTLDRGEQSCVLLHASADLAFASVGAAVQQQQQGGDNGSNGSGWRDLGLLCGGSAARDCASAAVIRGKGGDDRIGVALPAAALAAQTTTTVVVRLSFTYSGRINDSRDQLGLWRSPVGNLLSTQLEPDGARRLLPCVDAPAAKATFEVAVALPQSTTPATALSNGRARKEEELMWLDDATGEVVAMAATEKEEEQQQQPPPPPKRAAARLLRFSPSPLMSPYLLAVAIGDIECTTPLNASATQVRICSARGRAAAVAAETGGGDEEEKPPALASQVLAPALQMAAASVRHYSRLTALPYASSIGSSSSKLDVLLAPGKGGAMENLALPIFDEARLLLPPPTPTTPAAASANASSSSSPSAGAWALWRAADVLCHEIAHQWAGDLATALSWRELAINEGAATLLEYGCLGEALASLSSSFSSAHSHSSWLENLAIAAATLWQAPPAIPGLSPGVHEGALAKARTADASPLAPALLVVGAGAESGEPSADFGPVTYSKGAALLGMLSSLGETAGGGGAAAAALLPPGFEDNDDDDNDSFNPSLLPPFVRSLRLYLRERAFGALTLNDAAVRFLLPFAPPPLGARAEAAAKLYARAEDGDLRVGDGGDSGGRRRRKRGKKRRRAGEEEDDDEEEDDTAAGGATPIAAAADAFFRSWAERPGRPIVGVSVEVGPSSSSPPQLRVRQARLCAWGLVAPGQEEEQGVRRALGGGGKASFALECPGGSSEDPWWLALAAGSLGGSDAQARKQWLMLPSGEGGGQAGSVVSPAPPFASSSPSSPSTWSLHADGGLSGIYYAHHCDARHRSAVRIAAAADAVAAAAALVNASSSAPTATTAAAAAVNRITRAAVLLRDAADVALSPPSLLPAWARGDGDDAKEGGKEALAAALAAAGAASAAVSSSSSSLGSSLTAYSLLAGVTLPVLRELDAQVWHDPACRSGLRAVARRALAPAVVAALEPSSSSSSLASSLLSRMLAGPLLADAALVWRDQDVARKLCASVVVVPPGAAPTLVVSSSLGPDARAAALATAAAVPPGCTLAVSDDDNLRSALSQQAKQLTAPLLSAEALFALAAGARGAGRELNATLALALGLPEAAMQGDNDQFASGRPPKVYAADLVISAAQAAVAGVGEKEEAATARPPTLIGPALAFVLDRWPQVASSLGEEDAWGLLIRLVRSVGGAAPTPQGTEALARALGGGKAIGRLAAGGDQDARRLRAVLGAAASRAEWTEAHGPGLCEALKVMATEAEGK